MLDRTNEIVPCEGHGCEGQCDADGDKNFCGKCKCNDYLCATLTCQCQKDACVKDVKTDDPGQTQTPFG